MNVLIGCEESGTVRSAFERRGHHTISCDLQPTRRPGVHVVGDILPLLDEPWDLAILFPPCTYSANSGAKHLYVGGRKENGPDVQRWADMEAGVAFFNACLTRGRRIRRRVVENSKPHGHALRRMARRYDQIIKLEWFGEREMKDTCLWLDNVPPLVKTNDVGPPPPAGSAERKAWERVFRMGPSPTRARDRSEFRPGVAAAMADQWGSL